jgi:hypothetical protein
LPVKAFLSTARELQVTGAKKCGSFVMQLIQRRIAMSVSSHLSELKRKHQSLSVEVEQAQRAPAADGLKVADLKKQKLRLKEEIERLSI